MKKIISLLLIAVLLLSCFATAVLADGETDTATSGELTGGTLWSLSDDGVLTLSGEGALPDFSAYSEQPWRASAQKITKLTVSGGITYIGAHSFELLPYLATVSLPSSLSEVGESAFERCYALKSIKMPAAVKRIGARAFADCWRLSEYNIAFYSSNLTYIGDEAFAGCTSLLTTNIPQRLTYLGDGAYLGCTSLDGIELPDKLEYLGVSAFQSCSSLCEINIPWQITCVPDYAFFGCTSLEKVSFGRHLAAIGREAFLWCPALKSVHIPKGVVSMPDYSFGYYYFNGEYRIYDGLSISTASDTVADYARRHGIELILDDSTHVCETVCPYCSRCASDCEYLACADKCPGHTFPITGDVCDSITWSLSEDFVLTLSGTGEMPDFTYNGAPWSEYKIAVRHVVIENGITSVGSYTFDSHDALIDVSFADSVTSIGRKAFALCTSLRNLTAPAELTELHDLAFFACSSLESVSFGEWLCTLGERVFADCGSLREISLPDGLESIGDGAFENCESLAGLYIPSSVVHIGDRAAGYYYSADRHYKLYGDFVISGELFGAGYVYAVENGIEYIRTDEHGCEHKCELCGRCLDAECEYPECAKKCDGICGADWTSPFKDVKKEHWYYDHVRYVCLAGIMNGMTKNTFEPNGEITRAQLVLILWRLAGEPEPTAESPFSDLTASWYRKAVDWGYESGVVTGRTATSFDPMGSITREELVTMIMRYSSLTGALDTDSRAELSGFADASRVHAYAREAVSWAVAEGLIGGKTSSSGKKLSLVPRDGATRAECAAVFERFLKKL